MATIEWGTAGGTMGPPLVRFSDQPLTYARTENESYYEALKKLLNARFDLAENHHRSRFERFYRYEKLIHMVSKKKQYDWKANAFLPYAYAVSEQSAAIKWLALFLSRPYVTVSARVAELDEVALRRQALLDWHYTGDMDLIDLGIDMFRQCERYGKSIALVTPKWDTEVFKHRARTDLPTAYGPLARYKWKMEERQNYRIAATLMDLTDFFGQPHRRRINGDEGMAWAFRRFHKTMDELVEMEEGQLIGESVGGQSIADVRQTKQQDISDFKLRRMFLGQMDDVDRYSDPFDQSVEILEYQGRIPRDMIDPQKAEMESRDGRNPYDRLVLLANRTTIIEDIAMPWDHGMKSYVEMDCVPDPYGFWGKGKIEPIEHLNYVGNEIVNMRLDNVKMNINGLIGVNSTQMPPGWRRRLVSQPWGVIETRNNPNEVIQRLQMGDVTQSSYTEQQAVWSLIQEADAVNETLLGAPGPERTLGEHQLKLESSSKRLQFELVGQAKQMLGAPGGLSDFIIKLDRQYLPVNTYIKVVQPDTPDDFTELLINPEDFEDEDKVFAYYATGATEGVNAQAKRADLGQMLMALQPFGAILAQSGFDFTEMVKVIIKTFGYDPARFYPKTGSMGPGQGLAAVQQAMAGMPPGMGPEGVPTTQGLPTQLPQSPGMNPMVPQGTPLNDGVMNAVRGMNA